MTKGEKRHVRPAVFPGEDRGAHPAQPHRHDGSLRLPVGAGRHHDRGHAGLLRGPGQGGRGPHHHRDGVRGRGPGGSLSPGTQRRPGGERLLLPPPGRSGPPLRDQDLRPALPPRGQRRPQAEPPGPYLRQPRPGEEAGAGPGRHGRGDPCHRRQVRPGRPAGAGSRV